MFRLLMNSGLGFDEVSLSGAFSASAVIKGHVEGIQIHGLAIKSSYRSNVCVSNAIMGMYGKCGALAECASMFDDMERRDAVSWNAVIAAYEQNKKEEETLSVFVWMLRSRMEPDDFTYGSVLKACAAHEPLSAEHRIDFTKPRTGKKSHSDLPETSLSPGKTLNGMRMSRLLVLLGPRQKQVFGTYILKGKLRSKIVQALLVDETVKKNQVGQGCTPCDKSVLLYPTSRLG
ncbi:hypothetical protein RJ639_010555 [Escallonia herrerae]|uniref:Pentatricopeptide repeat-containing protein n=1 Tax=Escallonia herrerae TaxID=1293975 RepID=A0AA89ARI6_9ASTE|nr:hypothetical protein RJ639_010555 [Escallonia herrerae]